MAPQARCDQYSPGRATGRRGLVRHRVSIMGYAMRSTITTFLLEEDSGAVTVDWVVLSAIVTALGASVTVFFVEGDTPIGAATVEVLNRATDD